MINLVYFYSDKVKLCFFISLQFHDRYGLDWRHDAGWTCNNHNSYQGSDDNSQGSEGLSKSNSYRKLKKLTYHSWFLEH